ncbi:MAG: LysM peptidoglycan-binding domain-containing protein [Actinobacteria bacterium]|nr:LysM peptidoglycan-binding domain-containing protein [Actinomycetota bacterium]
MEVSPPLRWLGALAVMFVVVLIVVPLLLQTISDTVVLGGEPSEPALSEVAIVPSEASTQPPEAADAEVAAAEEDAEDEFPATYTVEAGDTGTKISEQFYDTSDGWSVIAEANDIDPSAPLRVGVELTIPAPE